MTIAILLMTLLKTTLLQVTACLNLPLVLRYLDASLDPNRIRPQDVRTIVAEVASNPAGFVVAWRHFQMHWEQYLVKIIHSGTFRWNFSMVNKIITQTRGSTILATQGRILLYQCIYGNHHN